MGWHCCVVLIFELRHYISTFLHLYIPTFMLELSHLHKSTIMYTYVDSQKAVEEVIRGLKQFFNRALGLVLLYTFERPQYEELIKQKKGKKKEMTDIYGAEHFLRLFGTSVCKRKLVRCMWAHFWVCGCVSVSFICDNYYCEAHHPRHAMHHFHGILQSSYLPSSLTRIWTSKKFPRSKTKSRSL